MCCPLLKRFNTRQQERHIAAQTAAVSSFLNRAFGKPPHTNGGTSGLSSLIYSQSILVAISSSLDGSIYSTAEDTGAHNPGQGDKRSPPNSPIILLHNPGPRTDRALAGRCLVPELLDQMAQSNSRRMFTSSTITTTG